MTKAEEAALKAFPRFTAENITEVTNARHFFEKGYEAAEKDLALTWEDVQIIWMETEQYMIELRKIERTDLSKFPSSSREIFEEILRRYKEARQ